VTALSFKARLTLWHLLAVLVILAATALVANWALSRAVLDQMVDESVLALAEAEGAALTTSPQAPIRVHEMPPGTSAPSFARLDKFVQIVAMDGHVVARGMTLGTARLPTRPALLTRVRDGETVFETVTDFGEEPVRMVSLPVDVAGTRYAVQVAMSLDDAYAVLRSVRRLFIGMAVGILLGVGLTGILLTRRALRPIDRIVARAREIGESSAGERLPSPGQQDEIGRLVDTLNDMLARIEGSFEVQRRFTADAAHELQSPLSRLRTELEVTLRRRRDTVEYEETLRSCLEKVERLAILTKELLTLARLDTEQGRPAPAHVVRLGPVLEGAVRRLAGEAEKRGVTVALHPSQALSLSVRCGEGLADLVFTNVLDNAVKFSPPGGRIVVDAEAEGSEVVVAVSDAGPGIPAEEISRVFERFYRGRDARAHEPTGFGLGLAISEAVVRQHGGHMSVESAPGSGSTFRVRLPVGT
jgi:two-component system, OmpR family, sensor kinase